MRALHAALVAVVVVLAGAVTVVAAPGPPAGEASIDRVGSWQAPADEVDLDDAVDVRAAIDDGSLARASGVDEEDVLVIGLRIRGFESAVADAEGSTTTERFLSVLSEHGDLTVRQTNFGTNQLPAYVHVLHGDGVRVFEDAATDTYYLAVDLDEANVTRGRDGDEYDPTHGPYRFAVRAALAADSPLTDGSERGTAPVAPRETSVEVAPDGGVHLQPAANQTVSGTTNVGTGWNVTVVLAGDDDPDTAAAESFRAIREATVETPDDVGYRYERSFDVAFDLDDVPGASRNVTVDVRLDGRSLLAEPTPVEIADWTATAAVDGATEDGQSTGVNVAASLSSGGFLVLHEESRDGPVVGYSAYLDPGEHTVTVYVSEPTDADEVVVVAHRDATHNEWFDGPDVDPAYAEADPVDAAAVELTGPATPTVTPTVSPPTGPTGTTTPGFGAVATAAALVLTVTALARRRC